MIYPVILVLDTKSPKVKRGRGRPRKSENTENSQNLEEDLQFSSDEDDFEEVSDQDHETTNLLNQGEKSRFKQEGKRRSLGNHSSILVVNI